MMTSGQPDFSHIIPNKLYFRIGEVSKLLGERPSVLRYWESEFFSIRPTKSNASKTIQGIKIKPAEYRKIVGPNITDPTIKQMYRLAYEIDNR